MSLPRYERYKDSGVEWIGEIPEGWEVKRLKFLSSLISKGTTPSTIGREILPAGDVRFIKAENILNNSIVDEPSNFIDQATHQILNRSQLEAYDILFVIAGATIGKVAILPETVCPANTNQAVSFIRLDNKESVQFGWYWLQSDSISKVLWLDAVQSAQPNLSMENLGNFYVPLPALPEQTAIASFLDRKTAEIDQLIANKEKLIALYEEEKTVIINRAVTKGLDPQVKLKPSGVDWLGDISEHWEVKRLKYLTSILNDGTHGTFKRTASGYRLLSVRNIINDEFVFLDDDSRVSEEDFDIITKPFLVAEGDLQLAIVGATLGKVAIVPKLDEKFATQRSVATIRTKQELVHNKFLFYFLKSSSFQSFLWLNAGFSAQPGIYLGSLANCHIPTPDLTEQIAIVAHIETECSRLDAIIDKFKKQIDLFKEYRTTLISEVVTGKIDIRDEVAA